MLSTQQYEPTNQKWEDLEDDEKTWARWKKMYKSVEAKAKVRHIAAGRKDQFGLRIVPKKGPLFLVPPKEPPLPDKPKENSWTSISMPWHWPPQLTRAY